MEMSDEEICRSYRQAKHKAQQIQILTELNQCSSDEIIRILQADKIQVGSRTVHKLKEEKLLASISEISEPEELSAPADWHDALRFLTEHVTELIQQRDSAVKELDEIYQVIGTILKGDAKS